MVFFFFIFFCFFFFDFFSGLGSTFFGTSFFFNYYIYNQSDIEFLNVFIKILPLIITFLGIFFSFLSYVLVKKKFFFFKKFKFFNYVYKFLLKKWFTDRFSNEIFGLSFLNFCNFYVYKKLDRGLLEIFGPTVFSTSIQNVSKISSKNYKSLFL